jgi:dTDP-4-amino-4,6-dideoxygalactose transaminase
MTARPIHSQPHVSLRLLMRPTSRTMAKALAVAPTLYHFSRDAIHSLFSALGYPSGTPVWMPSFHCGMEVRAAADAGFAPRFYAVKKDLRIDIDDLSRSLHDEPGPVLLIHYFGFPQPGTADVAALCRQAGVPFVEDCSHAFLSRFEERELGSFGQAATFSLYKTLGTSDGGALRVDQEELSRLTGQRFSLLPPSTRPIVAWDAYRKKGRSMAMVSENSRRKHSDLVERFEQRVITARRRIFAGEWIYGCGISRFSRAVIRRLDAKMVLERRRRNYLLLEDLLHAAQNYRPVLPSLPPETCPLYLPIFVRQRTEILVRLQLAQVEPFIFGMFNHPAMDPLRFPASRQLREEILCLPVHQNLDAEDLKRLASLLLPLLEADVGNSFAGK